MADTNVITPAPRRRRGWLRTLVWALGIFIILLVVLYFVGTSGPFFRGVILPRVGKSMNAEITVAEASISPFKEVILRNLRVKTTGDEPLLTAQEVRAHYSLMDIIRGNIHVDDVTVSSPTIVVIQNPDGSSNLDPITKSQKQKSTGKKAGEAEPSAKSSKATQIDLKKLSLKDATVRYIKLYQGGHRDVTELSHVNVTVDDVRNSQSGKLVLNADLVMDNNPPSPGTNGVLQGKVTGNFAFSLSPDLKPASVQGSTRLEVTKATGSFEEAAALAADLDCQITPTEIKKVAVQFSKGNARLGQLLASGPFDMEKTEGHLTVQLLAVDKQLLNLAGAGSGLDFGPTTLNSTNDIQIAKGGSAVTASGQFALNKLQVTRAGETTPALDFLARYNVTVDRGASNALLNELTFNGTQNGQPLLQAQLTSPMALAWGNPQNAVGDSALNLAITSLNLADWKPFLGKVAPAGMVNAKVNLVSQQAGKHLTFDLNSQIENLTAIVGSNQLTRATVTLQAKGQAADLKQFDFTGYDLKLAQQDQPVLTISGAGTYDTKAQSADLTVTAQASLVRLFKVMPQPDASFSAGTVELKGHVIQREKTQAVTGNLALSDLTGHFGKTEFRGFGASMDLDVGATSQAVQIRRVAGQVTEGGQAGGNFDVAGTSDLATKAVQLTAKLNFNQNGLRPFLEPMLADKKLVSVAINGSVSTQYLPQGDSSVKADLQVTNLVVSDSKNPAPSTPLDAQLQLDASLHNQVADVRQGQITLTPTDRAKNQVQFTGHVDMSQTNAMQGQVKLVADSLDVTRYYDLFAGGQQTAGKKSAATATASTTASAAPATPAASAPSPGPEKEPDAKQLPFRNFTAEVNVGRLYLREVEVTNWQTLVKIDGGHVVLNPCKLALNGAPVNADADIDLNVPGYKYAVGFGLKAVPLAPLVNSFQPERKGQVGGTLTADAKISGTGTTGPSLQKTLAGQFNVDSTNLNLSIVDIKSPLLKLIVNTVALIPELVHNPLGAATTLLGETVGSGNGGLADELKRAPVNSIVARGTAGSGNIDLQQAVVQSAAFRADSKGTITLAPILTNSAVHLPITVSLSQPIAQRIGIGSADTNAAYVALPDFLLVTGTVGNPKPDRKKLLVLGGSALQGIAGALKGGGGSTANILQGLGGLLGAGSTPAPATNAPGNTNTNAPTGRTGGLLNGLLGGGSGNPSSGNASTNQPATNQSPAKDLLNQLFKPKQ